MPRPEVGHTYTRSEPRINPPPEPFNHTKPTRSTRRKRHRNGGGGNETNTSNTKEEETAE